MPPYFLGGDIVELLGIICHVPREPLVQIGRHNTLTLPTIVLKTSQAQFFLSPLYQKYNGILRK